MMKKIIDELINNSIEGVDVYRYNNATWLIFTDDNKWVVELTDEGTLWYNYIFFSNILRYVSLECGEETDKYITGWVNDYFSDGVKDVRNSASLRIHNRAENLVRMIVGNGIKNTWPDKSPHEYDWSDDFDAGKVIERGDKVII